MLCSFDEIPCGNDDKRFVCFRCAKCARQISVLKTLKPHFDSIFAQLPECGDKSVAPVPAVVIPIEASADTQMPIQQAPNPHPRNMQRPNKPPAPPFEFNPTGAGSQLKKLLSKVGIRSSATCSCNARAKKMDEMGIEWCEQNIPEIVGWLKEEAAKRKLPFLAFPAKVMIQRAIKMAKKAQASKQLTDAQ